VALAALVGLWLFRRGLHRSHLPQVAIDAALVDVVGGPGKGKYGNEQLLPGLFRRASATEATSEGYRLGFDSSPETLHAVAIAIEAERHCCRFLRFELAVEPDEGPLVLTLSGPPGAREFLEALCDS